MVACECRRELRAVAQAPRSPRGRGPSRLASSSRRRLAEDAEAARPRRRALWSPGALAPSAEGTTFGAELVLDRALLGVTDGSVSRAENALMAVNYSCRSVTSIFAASGKSRREARSSRRSFPSSDGALRGVFELADVAGPGELPLRPLRRPRRLRPSPTRSARGPRRCHSNGTASSVQSGRRRKKGAGSGSSCASSG